MLGLVLLIGMVATISVGIVLVAGETITSIEQQSEQDRVENAFVELGQQMATASSNDDTSRAMNLEIGQDGAVVRKNTGSVNVTSAALENDIDLTIGTIEYESSDGTVLAYQAGTVFRETGNETQLVSSPPIYYDTATETLTLPVVTVSGKQKLGSGNVFISHRETKTYQEANVVENESVTITIESDYYRGWESYFRTQAGDTVVQSVDHDNRTLKVRVGYLEIEEAFEDGILISENFDDFENADVEDGDIKKGSMPELDEVIAEMIDDIEDGSMAYDPLPTTDGTVADNGTYWQSDELHIEDDDELTFDVSDGNSTLIVDDNITIDGDVYADTDGTDHELKIYTTGHVDLHNGNVSVDDGTAAQLQLYGTSETHIGIQTSSFEGTIYAPRDETWGDTPNAVFDPGCSEQVCMQANVEFDGALIASSAYVHSASVDFEYDTSLENNDIDLYPDSYELPPQLTYLNVARHEVTVKNN